MTLLLGVGASVDLALEDSLTPLDASQKNNIEVVTLLLGAGVSVDLATDDGYTTLYSATQENYVAVVTLLLGADQHSSPDRQFNAVVALHDLDAHHLFPSAFWGGVRHILGLMLELEQVGRGLPQHIRMLVIAAVPRD